MLRKEMRVMQGQNLDWNKQKVVRAQGFDGSNNSVDKEMLGIESSILDKYAKRRVEITEMWEMLWEIMLNKKIQA